MRKDRGTAGRHGKPQVRVAIYTRKSTSDGLDQELNSLQAQRQTVEAYIQSQRLHGWQALPEAYDDGGFTGANTERPAFRRLLADIEAGRIDCVAVYKIDRLSRSLSDFAHIMDLFEEHEVTFVSVTQQFSTATSVGKLTLNLLMSFAEFERDVISERTRDKIAACRRRGMWTGGRPVLGYDVEDRKLVVNETEAEVVREIFALYLERGSLLETVRELERRGIRNKSFRSRAGRDSPGRPFTKTSLHHLLTNPLYAGKVRAGKDLADGVHEPIVAEDLFETVQAKLRDNGPGSGKGPRSRWPALLEGLLVCGTCGRSMGHQYTTKDGRTYRYYVCQTLLREGAQACPGSRVPAGLIEAHVRAQVERLGEDPALRAEACEVFRGRPEQGWDWPRPRERPGQAGPRSGRYGFEPGPDELWLHEREGILRAWIAEVRYTPADDQVDILLRRRAEDRAG